LGAWIAGCGGAADNRPGVLLLRYKQGSESTEQREAGFLDTLRKEFPEIHILADDQYSGVTREDSLVKAKYLLQKYEGRLQGIFAVCEPNATGVLKALEDTRLAKEVKFIAFDSEPGLMAGLTSGKVHGIVLQDPAFMGEMAVKTLVGHLEKKLVERRISTGEYVATPENKEEAKIKSLLSPPQADADVSPTGAKYRVAVIPKGTSHEFWKSVRFGANKAATELGNVAVQWNGPLRENDTEDQIRRVRDFITKEVDGICLAPNDSRSLVAAVREAKAAGIPVVIFDSGLEDQDAFVSYVATDNYKGGVLAARRLAEVLGVKPKPQ
jgi:ABC-type sugar transport system substrate-binding protein